MRQPLLFDGRNLCAPEAMAALGFDHQGIGRGHVPRSNPVEPGSAVTVLQPALTVTAYPVRTPPLEPTWREARLSEAFG